MRSHLVFVFALLTFMSPILVGCKNSPPTRFYVLSAAADEAATQPGGGVAIGVGPVVLPQYLSRPQIVTRTGANQLTVAEFDQWGGDLDDNVTRVLSANLANLLGTERVSLYPWKDEAPIDYQVTIDVIGFEQTSDGGSMLAVYWSVIEPSSGTVRLMRRSSYRDAGGAIPVAEAPSDETKHSTREARPYDAVVAAMSRNLGVLSRDIASAISGLAGS
jgi:uncharacterized lipoprotein YmbA